MRSIAIAHIVVLLAASTAQAARVVAGPMFVASGQTFSAGIVNVSTKPLTNVTVQCRNNVGTIIVNASSPQIDPDRSFNPGFSGPATVSCAWSADQGAKSFRAALQNVTTGAILRAE